MIATLHLRPLHSMLLAAVLGGLAACGDNAATTAARTDARPALTVAAVTPQAGELADAVVANGNLAAWQEVVVGAETGGFRLTEVRVNVGDPVRRGQVLAQVSPEVAAAELAQARASLAEARAALAEAAANAGRARRVIDSGVMSAQQVNQYLTAEKAAAARVEAAEARSAAESARHAKLTVVAPDDGVISARTATVGALATPGQELFRMIRGQRLEWRAEVTAAEFARLAPGMPATIALPGGPAITATVRALAPTIDPQTRNGIVYVDLPLDAMARGARAGMFVRGEFRIGRSAALTLPQSAIVQREGYAYVFRIEGGPAAGAAKVVQQKVAIGRRAGDRVEIVGGIDAAARVVESGAGFLADGDAVRLVAAATAGVAR